MAAPSLKPGAPIYATSADVAKALSLGAVMHEGDGRLFIPNILPDGVSVEHFRQWTSEGARLAWLGELIQTVVGAPVDLFEIAGLVAEGEKDERDDVVLLFVPQNEMDVVRHISGVSWDRGRRRYVARRTADFALVHKYLTPAMRSAWVAERNIETAMTALVRARALVADAEDDGEALQRELDPEADAMKAASDV